MNAIQSTRFINVADIPVLLELEHRQWSSRQAATAASLHRRIAKWPHLCVGAFCHRTGTALASLFMRPITREQLAAARRWSDCAGDDVADEASNADSLFGISLTSVQPGAAASLFRFFWPHALKGGWRDIYLGSPIPGFGQALQQDPSLDAERYVQMRRSGMPADPQLRYYHRKGFRDILAVLPDYFPHEASLNHAALLRGRIPLSWACPVFGRLPFRTLRGITDWLSGSAAGLSSAPVANLPRPASTGSRRMAR